MHIDEVGNSDLGSSQDPNHRYLSLTGIIIDLNIVRDQLFPSFEYLKQNFFDSHPDNPVIFHWKELVNKNYPFHSLRKLETEKAFNAEFLDSLKRLEFVAITTVIDKLEHCQRYQVWRHDPYHYCMEILVERYAKWLDKRRLNGDIMIEARNKTVDRRLKESFRRICSRGTSYTEPELFGSTFTSSELKIEPKYKNIPGLQLADLIAHPSFKAMLASRNRQPVASNFGGEIVRILRKSKYDRSPSGRIDGWGTKWLP